MENWKISKTLLIITVALLSCQHQAHETEWELVWEDDFDRSDIFSTGEWRKINREYPTPDWMFHISDYEGCFDIVNSTVSLKGLVNTYVPEDTAKFLTGGITTKGLKSFQNGRIEVKAKLQAGRGAWPAIWLLPDEGGWPEGGEIDIMERLHHDDFIHQTIHSSYTVHLKKTELPPHHTTVPFDASQFNIFAVELGPDSIAWFVNDLHTFTYPRLKDEFAEQNGQYPFDRPYHLIIDMQLGATWMPPVEKNDLPVEMLIDWVRFYKKKDIGSIHSNIKNH